MKSSSPHFQVLLYVFCITVFTVSATAEGAPSVLRVASDAARPGTFDPHFAASDPDRMVADMLFNGLVRYRPGNAPIIEPDLAESIPEPEIVEGGKQIWTFKLREGVMFHSGPGTESYELTADDVIFSLRKSADPERSAYSGEYIGMTFEKVDRYTVRIILEKPISSILFLPKVSDYAGGFIVSMKAYKATGEDAFEAHPVGTGPFHYESYTPGGVVRLIANERYFRGPPLLDAVEIFYIPDVETREDGLLNGMWDVITCFGKEDISESIKQEKSIVVDVLGPGQVKTMHFNTLVEPFSDIRVRKAIAYAVDRDTILNCFSRGTLVNVYSIVPPDFLPGGLTKKEVESLGLDYRCDIGKARELLIEAGYPDGFSLEVISSELLSYLLPYQSLKDQLAGIGIDIEISIVDHPTMHKLIRQDVNPIILYGAWRPNADVYLTRFFHSDSIVVTGAKPDTNFSHYDKLDDLIEAARIEIDPSKQIELWRHAQIMILQDMVAYPLHYLNQIFARRNYVDYGHEVVSSMALYPQITEKTRIRN
jgi:peptide/nickel transport system substrate-binding protein